MSSMMEFIEAHRERILERWREGAQTTASARGLTRPELFNLIPVYLALLSKSTSEDPKLSDEQQHLIESHLSHRLRQGYELNEVQFEFALLGRTLSRLIAEQPATERPPADEVGAVLSQLMLTSHAVTRIFTEHLLEDEQREKRYVRLISQIAEESLAANGRAAPLASRLREVLALIMEAMEAQSASLLLTDPHDSRTLIAVASTGLADEAMEHYATSIDLDSFASRVAASDSEPLELPDVVVSAIPVSETLKQSGIRSLLGMRLPARHTLRGVLYVGLCDQRNFTASELRRLATLGGHLTLQLDNAHLVAELRSKIAAVQVFVDVLVHDLRGPLSAAKLAATMIDGDEPGRRERARTRLVRTLDRADRMVTDLLDAHRVESGERLHLTMSRVDLVAVVRDVAEELSEQFPDRVIVRAPSELYGTWSSPYVRRAVWNLVVNGLKYGAADEPVTVEIMRCTDRVEIAVHNSGPAIPADQQDRLFKMFARGTDTSRASGGGWGLGLALVRGAAEAHGGSVDVASEVGKGTTFTMRLPLIAAETERDVTAPMQP